VSELVRIDERVPVRDRIDFYRDMCAGTWVPMDVSFERSCERVDAGLSGEFRASGMGPLQVVVMDILPVTVRRTERHIARDAPDLLKAYLVCEGGPVVIRQGGRQAVLTAGDLAFYDTRRPYEGVLGTDPVRPLRGMTFMFPPSLLPLSPTGVRELTATRIPATAGVGELTSQFLLQLARNVEHYTPAEAARLSSCALEVLATRLARELGIGDRGTPEARRRALLTTVQGFIQQNLGDSGLSPATVAAAHHISLRTLHQLFHEEGRTVAGYIRARRLERCRRDLADPALDSRPVSAIAARWGFASAADFSRAFRAAHGMPPAEYRRSARIVKGLAL
jgi:AraC-like DNA-binding protein